MARHVHQPVFSGSATISDGRLRHFSLPHSLESINGRVSFDASGIRVDEVTGRLGGGDVTFGGRIGLNGFALGDLNLTAIGERMTVRYPEGFRSIVDADLGAAGNDERARAERHGRSCRTACGRKRIETSPDLFNLDGCVDGLARSGRGVDDAAAALRRRRSTRPRACASRTTSPTWWPAPTCGCRAPTIGRCSSAAPRSSAAMCSSRATASSSRRAAASTSSTRRGSSPSSTSRPRRACAGRASRTG